MQDRLPPQNLEAEQSVLGAVLIDKDAFSKIVDMIKSVSFYRDAHKMIFEAMISLYEKSEPIDIITITNCLREKNLLDAVGGSYYLTQLINSVPTSANITYYAKIVDEKALLRDLISAGSEIVRCAFDESLSVESAIDQSEKIIMNVAQMKIREGFIPIKDILSPVMDRIESIYDKKDALIGIPTGFTDLDQMTSGFQKADLIILAARPSMGKTAFCLNIAANIALKNKLPVAIFSLEMSKESLVQRMLCSDAEIDAQRLKTGNLHDHEWKKLTRAIGRLSEAPVYIDDTASVSLLELKAKARRLQAERGISLIIIDYLQLMQGGKSRNESRNQEISEIARGLKSVGRELNVPILALSQLSRAVEQRQEKIPRLSDLRESGEIEQTADLVCFIHREDYYNAQVENGNEAEIIIAKQRNGPTGSVKLFFKKEITKFHNIEKKINVAQEM
ncbi:MAG: replicative DNA helicase [Candidatus Margulisiibacteriota bacterium]|nr:MAG: replicative DNA helicase [Candidatus Margulisbacteria bacterium GWD2_39_127]OGI05409.1 MAG: replicative DNA helicase [Candidatus Margulisbacteria bacterium GWF2_38_17]OGI08665.1 MAG: replicative DNA helicase [Candidatus Margulisbacteria bacterium GWE2_39_32]PZM77032.1 MAG: replicative DNA helicase [Candidatus Margulisiibacteriota bacterium]HAR62108.1 replicative DNA helicase [Candidatus Margulisiibacteriota bacterium]